MGINILSKITGYSLFLVSCIFSAKLMIQFGAGGLDKMVWAVCGISFMAAEFICAVVGVRLVLHKKFGFATIFGILYVSLYFVSLFGTLGFESASSTNSEKQAGLSDSKLVLMQDSLAKMDGEIASLTKQAEGYATLGYYTKAAKPVLEKIDGMNEKREQLFNQIMVYKPTGDGATAFWGELAKFMGSDDPGAVKFGCFLLIAALLDLTGAAMTVVSFDTFKRFIEKEPSEAQYFGCETLPDQAQATFRNQTVQEDGQNTGARETPFRDSGNEPERKPEKEPISEPIQPEPATAQTRTPIGFAIPRTVRGTSTVHVRYLDYAFSNIRKNGNFPSRRVIADKIGISQSEADQIHSLLKQRGLVRVDGIRTMPQLSKIEMLEKVRE